MSDTPWSGDACSLVDAFRAGERSPVEELDATLAATTRTSSSSTWRWPWSERAPWPLVAPASG